MNEEEKEGLKSGLKIECGVYLRLSMRKDEENKDKEVKAVEITGQLRNKAFGVIYNHPAVAFERR